MMSGSSIISPLEFSSLKISAAFLEKEKLKL